MTEIIRAGEANSLGHIDTIQGDFRTQIDALTDAVRQLGGNPEIEGGTTVVNDPLNAPYVLYVNSQIGSDKFVSGDYASADDGSYEQKMRRISLQRLECGYTVNRPFRTISRAVLEAGIITSRDYLNLDPAPCGDLVTIVLASGVHEVLNGEGTGSVSAWADGKEPTDDELTAFNPSNGGLVLPRGCSVVSLDLRKTIVRPTFVPAPADEAADGSNRRAIFKITGGCYMYGFTIMDKVGLEVSHHLLDGFQFAGKTALDEFYANIVTAFGAVANIDSAYAITRPSEYQITGPQPPNPEEAVDTTAGASPYIYNISIRSEWGICGMWASGALTQGFKSMVVAQYTGVSLQRDLTCWQRYSGGTWGTFSDYDQFIGESPNNVRFNPARRSYHVRTSNNAIIQEVSVFAIGQAIHHLAESGSQITITNSNSNFGGCAAIATGFIDTAAPRDTPWDVEFVRRALNPTEKSGNIKKIFLGTIEMGVANSATTLKLTADFEPELLTSQEYSLEGGNYLWVDNPGGPDYRALMTATPWDDTNPDQINITSAVTTDNSDGNRTPDGSNELPDIEGNRIYVRRLRDVRSVEERRYSIILSQSGSERLPIRDYVIQPESGSDWTDRIQAISQVEGTDVVTNGANVELRYSARPDSDTAHSSTVYYRPTDVVRRENKHWTARVDNYGPWNKDQWDESYVHMNEAEYCPEGFFINAQPIIIFNEDTSEAEDSTTLGNDLSGGIEQAQLVSGVDYIATQQFLENLGVDAATAESMLLPQKEADRNLDVSGNSWVVEFRRPTTIRLFGHAFEWAGYTNYSKALPQYQGELSQSNQFTYYFTNEDGGKVYGSGFNQDGLLVTPRGLQDVTTGETLDLENIGNPDRPIDIPPVDVFWTRAGTTLQPTYPGDTVTVTSTGGAVNISLNPDGSAEYVAKVQSASTVQADPGKTLVTKDYLEDGGKGAEGDLGFWTREGTDLYPVNGNTDSIKLGGTLPGTPNIDLRSNGIAVFQGETATFDKFSSSRTTGTDACFGGFLNTANTSSIYADGTMHLGGVQPATPNIALNADGSGDYVGKLISRDGAEVYRDDGIDGVRQMFKLRNSNNYTRTAFYTDGRLEIGGDIDSGDPNIELNTIGTGKFSNQLILKGNVDKSANSFFIYGGDYIADTQVYNIKADGSVYIGGTDLNTTAPKPNISLNANGIVSTKLYFESTRFGNLVQVGGGSDGAILIGGASGGTSTTFAVDYTGEVKIGGTYPAAPNIRLNPDGSGYFAGTVTKGGGTFKISHPLPALNDSHYLVHSFVEGPQADNIYRGKVKLNNGTATVDLDAVSRMTDGTFVALNTNVDCFTSNETDWTLVRGSVVGNTLTIEAQDSTSDAEVTWLVIGERQDKFMLEADWTDENGRVIPEPLKPVTQEIDTADKKSASKGA